MIRKATQTLAALLGLFHGWLFAAQVWNGQLDSERLLRWLVAGGLIAAAVALRRRGVSIVRGRKAVAVWLLAALLHGPALAQRIGGAGDWTLAAATLTQAAFASAAAGLIALLAWLVSRRSRAPLGVQAVRRRAAIEWLPALHPAAFAPAVPRPPPAA